jgi:Protein of unknown function, DUF547
MRDMTTSAGMWAGSMRRLLATMLCLIAITVGSGSRAGPEAVLWKRWLAHDRAATTEVDHGAWETFLTHYVRIGPDNIHRVAYGEVTPADREALDAYLERLSDTVISRYNRTEQLAFWINLYNALVVDTVLEHYPIASIRDVEASAEGPFDLALIEVEGYALSLNDIQNRILRPIWRDPRVLYALSCAALGCPNLQPVPFTSRELDRQLSDAAMAYINDPRGARLEDQDLVVSSLFRWYRGDFGGSDQTVIHHLMGFATPRLAMKLQQCNGIAGDHFDWRLNDATS